MWLLIFLLLCIVFIIVATTRWKLHPILALLIAAFGYGIFCGNLGTLAEGVAAVAAILIISLIIL